MRPPVGSFFFSTHGYIRKSPVQLSKLCESTGSYRSYGGAPPAAALARHLKWCQIRAGSHRQAVGDLPDRRKGFRLKLLVAEFLKIQSITYMDIWNWITNIPIYSNYQHVHYWILKPEFLPYVHIIGNPIQIQTIIQIQKKIHSMIHNHTFFIHYMIHIVRIHYSN